MTTTEPEFDEDADETVVVNPLTPATDDDDEGTVVVDRPAPDVEPEDGATVVVDRPAQDDIDDEGTVVVDRPAPDDEPEDGATVVVERPAPDDEPEDGATVVVERDDPDSTVVVDRSDSDSTVVVDRADSDSTVVVDRDGSAPVVAAKSDSPQRADSLRVLPRRGANRQITRAPGVGAEKKGVVASGPGASGSYSPRAIPAPPPAPVEIPLGPEATRMDAPSMPSVSRHSRRLGRITMAVFAGSFLVSAVGLVLIVVALIRG
jgi:hypothetical protein